MFDHDHRVEWTSPNSTEFLGTYNSTGFSVSSHLVAVIRRAVDGVAFGRTLRAKVPVELTSLSDTVTLFLTVDVY